MDQFSNRWFSTVQVMSLRLGYPESWYVEYLYTQRLKALRKNLLIFKNCRLSFEILRLGSRYAYITL